MNERTGGRPLLSDVALEAGVSSTTASLVLNGKGGAIRTATQERVVAAAEALGYRPNALAKSLRSQRSQTIAVLSDRVLTTPYAAGMIEGAQATADLREYALLLGNISGGAAQMGRTIDAMLDHQPDAMVYASMYHKVIDPPTVPSSTPLVLLDARVEDGQNISWVVPDEAGGARVAVEHLLDHGHRRIAHISDSAGTPAAVERQAAYLDVLRGRGIEPDPQLVLASGEGPKWGADATNELLRLDDPPTAIFCFNDAVAAGAVNAARRHGFRVPDDLSIVGFDNQILVADTVDPGLTSVQLPHFEMGQWAIEEAFRLIDGDSNPQTKRMPCVLVERQSVTHPPSKNKKRGTT